MTEPSGLRNPEAAVRGAGVAALAVEALALLLAIQPIRVLGGGLGGWAIAAVLTIVGLAVVLAGLLRHRWAWYAGTLLQVALLVSGVLNGALLVLGVIFGLAWAAVLYLRWRVLGRVF